MRIKSLIKSKKVLVIALTLVFLVMSLFLPNAVFAGEGNIDDGTPKKLNLNLLLMYDADQANIDAWKEAFNRTSKLLYNSTEGQIQIGTVNVYINESFAKYWADVWVEDKDSGRANATRLGLDGSGRILLQQEDKDYNEDFKGYVTIVHELGHYVFGLWDEYQNIEVDENGIIKVSPKITEDGYCTSDDPDDPASLMDASRNSNNDRTEWCTPAGTDWNTAHNNQFYIVTEDGEEKMYLNRQEAEYKESCWETIVRICKEEYKDKYGITLKLPTSEPSTDLPEGHEDINWNIVDGLSRTVIAIDRSGSMSGEKIRLAKLGGSKFVDLVHTGDELGVVSFADDPSVDFPLQKYLVNGPRHTNLTNNYAWDRDPSFSPDGSKIVFESNRDGNMEIYIMNADGSEQTRLTDNPFEDADPSFSPDGSKIVFTSNRSGNSLFDIFGKNYEICIMNVDGTGQTRLTNNTVRDCDPCFSPDGSKIAFRSYYINIYIMNVDGSEQTILTDQSSYDGGFCFSPDGSKIVFESSRDGQREIYIMNVDGSEQTRLTNNYINDTNPRFSPDGSKIVFESSRDGQREIYIMNVDGSGQRRLTYNPADDSDSCFSPDGSKIAFESTRDGNREIYIMNVDVLTGSTKEDAQDAINALSVTWYDDTNIGGGLRTSLDQIVSAGEPTGNEIILLLSDGMYNEGENPSSVIPDLQARGVRVFTIGLGADADIEMLQNIADETGGKFFFAKTEEDLTDIFTSLSAELHGSDIIKGTEDTITASEQIIKSAYVDTFNKEATFILEWGGSDLDLTLKRPDGTIVDPEVAQTDPNIEYVEKDTYEYYRINEPMAGEWQLIIDAVDVTDQESFTAQVLGETMGVLFNVYTDKASYTYPESILIQADVIAVDYVANAEVTGTVIRPDGSTVSITLFDDGLASHGDKFPDDGVYSNYFSEYTKDGVYTFNMVVDNKEGIQAPFLGEIPPEGWTPAPIDPFTREASVSVSVVPLPATIDFDPDTLNLKVKGQWITAYIELPVGWDAADIDLSTVLLNGVVPAVTDPKYSFVTDPKSYITDNDGDGIFERMVKFDGETVKHLINVNEDLKDAPGGLQGEIQFTVSGSVKGVQFEGNSTILVILKGK